MSSSESFAVGTIEQSPFEDKSVAAIIEWVENVADILKIKEGEEAANPDVAILVDALQRAVKDYEAAPADEKSDSEKIVREHAQNLFEILKQGA